MMRTLTILLAAAMCSLSLAACNPRDWDYGHPGVPSCALPVAASEATCNPPGQP